VVYYNLYYQTISLHTPTYFNTHTTIFLVDFLEKSFIIVLLQKYE